MVLYKFYIFYINKIKGGGIKDEPDCGLYCRKYKHYE